MPADLLTSEENRVMLGPFEVAANGTLHPRDGDAPPCFSFAWRDRVIEARLDRHILRLVARIGHVPSTATHQPRPPAFETLRNLRGHLHGEWKVRLAASHAVEIEIATPLPSPPTAVQLMTEVTRRMLELAPYLDVFDEVGVGQH